MFGYTYYVIEWDDEDVDEPWRLYVEMDKEGRVLRNIEYYRVGFQQYHEEVNSEPTTIEELAGENGSFVQIERTYFDRALVQVFELSNGGIMGMGI